MRAYASMGTTPTWTCAPYQTAHAPRFGQQIAWGESNAVVFANSVIGARTERYPDLLDICCAITGRAPAAGLHLDQNRLATRVLRLTGIPESLAAADDFYPVLGHLLGAVGGGRTGGDHRTPGDARPGNRPGNARPEDVRTRNIRTGNARTRNFRTGNARTGNARPGNSRTGNFRTRNIRPGSVRPANARPEDARPEDARTGNSRTGNFRTRNIRPGSVRPANARTGGHPARTSSRRSGPPPRLRGRWRSSTSPA